MGGAMTDRDTYGVLVGWTHHSMGSKLDLKLQCVQSTRGLERDEVDSHHVMMTREQAAVLANYLFQITQRQPPRRRGLLSRWFGN